MTNVVKGSRASLPPGGSIHWNPSPEELRAEVRPRTDLLMSEQPLRRSVL
jgi:hypothetical protein